jgi:hypothetical protein
MADGIQADKLVAAAANKLPWLSEKAGRRYLRKWYLRFAWDRRYGKTFASKASTLRLSRLRWLMANCARDRFPDPRLSLRVEKWIV